MRELIERSYDAWVKAGHASSAHLPTLRILASQCHNCVEFGTKHGASATALLLGCPGEVWSYDILATSAARKLQVVAGPRWHYMLEDSLNATPPERDLLFVDSMHNYEHVKAELEAHADKTRKFLVFHDTITFGSVGAMDESGRAVPGVLGIRPAVDELMIRDRSWFIYRHDYFSHGLLILERRR